MNDRFYPIVLTSLLLAACQTPYVPPTPEQTGDYNRMQRVHFPNIDSVYRKPAADL